MKQEKLIEILESLKDNRGIIIEETVVDYARPKNSLLHDQFEWDDKRGGEKYRLLQAAELIHRVHVSIEASSGKPIVVRAFVSLATDRINGGGYRSMHDVLSDKNLHDELLKTALAELDNLQKRYQDLQELQPVFKAITKVIKRKHVEARV